MTPVAEIEAYLRRQAEEPLLAGITLPDAVAQLQRLGILPEGAFDAVGVVEHLRRHPVLLVVRAETPP